ncbi:MAG: hypothetical protein PHI35_05075 [Victivallaceae bacterium]|nr:hypothetical protein [Victivallaceae bacterium]
MSKWLMTVCALLTGVALSAGDLNARLSDSGIVALTDAGRDVLYIESFRTVDAEGKTIGNLLDAPVKIFRNRRSARAEWAADEFTAGMMLEPAGDGMAKLTLNMKFLRAIPLVKRVELIWASQVRESALSGLSTEGKPHEIELAYENCNLKIALSGNNVPYVINDLRPPLPVRGSRTVMSWSYDPQKVDRIECAMTFDLNKR